MLSYWWSNEEKGLFVSGIHSHIPDRCHKITHEEYTTILQARSTGKDVHITEGIVTVTDQDLPDQYGREWRDSELLRSDIGLNKVQDYDNKAVGTVAQWRDYRKALRAWPEHKDFPKKDFRPVPPDA